MSIPFFNDVLGALGRRLNYESISNLYGNSFCKDATKYISEANPLVKPRSSGGGFAELLAKSIINTHASKEKTQEAVNNALGGDVSWAQGLV